MLLGDQLVGEARDRRQRRMPRREQAVEVSAALLFLVVACTAAATIHTSREWNPLLAVALVLGYGAVSRVRFEYGDAFASAEQIVFVPMLVLLPLEYVPLLVCAGRVAQALPDVVAGSWHRDRLLCSVSDCWFSVGPALLLALVAPGEASLGDWEVYTAAILAEMACDLSNARVRDLLIDRTPLRDFANSSLGTLQVDAVLSPLAFILGIAALERPLVLLAIGPLIWLLRIFSQERRERYNATLELNRAYRGTVMLLADVVEFDDGYTADHSRSVVELVQAVSERMNIDRIERQEMEFAALLHDVGKISIPKEVLNKPARLTDEEFELMKTHTIEGQFLLDRVGGLLGRIGEIVRSCHERWDGAGYPDGLAGEQIPLAARIVFACDAYNAMTTDRPYRQAMNSRAALTELTSNAGSQFDPRVVATLVEVIEEAAPDSTVDDLRVLMSGIQAPGQAGTSPAI